VEGSAELIEHGDGSVFNSGILHLSCLVLSAPEAKRSLAPKATEGAGQKELERFSVQGALVAEIRICESCAKN
jgi:hypothetical protein